MGAVGLAVAVVGLIVGLRPIDGYWGLGLAIAGLVLAVFGRTTSFGAVAIVAAVLAIGVSGYSVHRYDVITTNLQRQIQQLEVPDSCPPTSPYYPDC